MKKLFVQKPKIDRSHLEMTRTKPPTCCFCCHVNVGTVVYSLLVLVSHVSSIMQCYRHWIRLFNFMALLLTKTISLTGHFSFYGCSSNLGFDRIDWSRQRKLLAIKMCRVQLWLDQSSKYVPCMSLIQLARLVVTDCWFSYHIKRTN